MTRDSPSVPSWARLALFTFCCTISETLPFPLWSSVAWLVLPDWVTSEILLAPDWPIVAVLVLPVCVISESLLCANAGVARMAAAEAEARRNFFISHAPGWKCVQECGPTPHRRGSARQRRAGPWMGLDRWWFDGARRRPRSFGIRRGACFQAGTRKRRRERPDSRDDHRLTWLYIP